MMQSERMSVMFGWKKKEKKQASVIKPIQRIETTAKLIHKSGEPIDALLTGEAIPIEKPIFELTFLCEDGKEIKATVSEFEFGNVEIGDMGKLVYDEYKYCNEIISFADKIVEFKM